MDSAVKNTDYLFSTSRVRAIENNLLDSSRIEKMLDAKNLGDAIKVLLEMGYDDPAEEGADPEDFERILALEHKKAYELVLGIVPDPKCFDFLLYQYDYHNIKTILKCEFAGVNPDEMLYRTGSVSPEKMKKDILDRDYPMMGNWNMAAAARDAIEDYAKNKDPQMIDILVDKICYEDISSAAGKLGNKFVSGYVALMIDTINLKTFVRMRQMKKPRDFFKKAVLEGGSLPAALLTLSYEEANDQITEKLSPFGFAGAFSAGCEALSATGKFTVLERLLDNHLLEYAKDAKYVPFGVEPIVGYLLAKENEIKTVRIILSGKKAGLKADFVKERLRNTYV